MAAQSAFAPHIPELYQPELLTIRVSNIGREFQVPRGLICAKSDYFKKAFSKNFIEGKTGVIELNDVEKWTFECFIAWLYTGQLCHAPDPGSTADLLEPNSVVRVNIKSPNEWHGDNPVTWSWKALIQCYIFADKYDTKYFRHDVLDMCILKGLQTAPREYLWPSVPNMCAAFWNLRDGDPLVKFLLDTVVYDKRPHRLCHSEQIKDYPPEILAKIATKAIQLQRCTACDNCNEGRFCACSSHPDIKQTRPDYYHCICAYHEHDTDEEGITCEVKWQQLAKSHGIKMGD